MYGVTAGAGDPSAAGNRRERGNKVVLTRAETRAVAGWAFVIVVFGHWVEHVLQAIQIYGLGRPPERALGALGLVVPGLVRSEWLHWLYNLALLSGIALLLPGFVGRARAWWKAALVAQLWHFGEHALLLGQAVTGLHLVGADKPTSVVQLVVPRVELHLIYNAIVTVLVSVGFAERWRLRKRPSGQPRPERPVLTGVAP